MMLLVKLVVATDDMSVRPAIISISGGSNVAFSSLMMMFDVYKPYIPNQAANGASVYMRLSKLEQC